MTVDIISKTFLILALAVALPLTIGNILIAIFKKNRGRRLLMILAIICLLLIVGTVVNAKIGLEYFEYTISKNGNRTIYSYRYHPCAWVALGLGSGALALSILPFIVAIIVVLMNKGEKHNRRKNIEVVEHVEKKFDGQYVLLTATSNVGIGLWTSICKGFASIFGVECKRYTKKMNRVMTSVNDKIDLLIKNNPDYTYGEYRIVKEGRLTYTASVMGKKSK